MKNSFTKQQQILFFISYIVIACCTLVDFNFRLSFLRYPFEVILHPSRWIEVRASKVVHFPASAINTFFKSRQIITELQNKNAQLMSSHAETIFLKQENQQLKAEIEKKGQQQVPTEKFSQIAHIISLGPVSYIDKGERDGIKPQDLVVSQGVLLGKIKEVDHYFSSAYFFYEGSWEVVAKTQSGVKGIVQGKHGKIYFTQVPSDQQLNKDELIVTVGSITDAIPPGIFVGAVEQINQEPGQPFQTAVINQSVQLPSLSIVQIARW